MKELISSKTFWLGIGTVAWGIYTLIDSGDFQAGMAEIIGGLGMIFLRHGVAKVQRKL